MRPSFLARLLACTVAVGVAPAAPAAAENVPAQPQLLKEFYEQATDPAKTFFDAGDPIPAFNSCKATSEAAGREEGGSFNPSGVYNAFDTNVFEVLCLPYRAANDKSDLDPEGNAPANADGSVPAGSTVNGVCGGRNTTPFPGPMAPISLAAGRCPNHQLEYIKYYKKTMTEILAPFGVTFRDYKFTNPGSGNTEAGSAINPAAIVAGAENPEESIVIGAHYDKTTEGPASVWDSQEGHAQIIRVAKIMADYWTRTGSRPNATIKFIPWDGEESGTLGSLDYTENNIVPGEEEKVRGYWNTDPCAGGYPAFRAGLPSPLGQRIALGIQTARESEIPTQFDKGRVTAFNGKAPAIVEEVFQQLQDTVQVVGGEEDIYVSMAEGGANADNAPGGPVAIGTERPVLFSSDWANFLAKGIPFFNPGPEVTGPSDTVPPSPGNPDGIAILHTPRDNFQTLNQQTGPNPDAWSDGWMKGMEMCSQLLAWGMLREDQGGAQATDTEVTAYYEALPNEARVGEPVTFDAAGTYQLQSPGSLVDPSKFDYAWDFGDGTTGTGPKPDHTYLDIGVYQSRLTVTNRDSGKSDTMTIPITVLGAVIAAPVLAETPAEDPDGTYDLGWTFDEPALPGFTRYSFEEAANFRNAVNEPAETLDGVVVTPPTGEAAITPWKLSKDAAEPDSYGGNLRHGGESSFYTGVSPADSEAGTVATPGTSILTFKEPVQLARDSTLTYWSLFANNREDTGRVEVAEAVDGELEWRTVDTVPYVNVGTPVSGPFEQRTADLSAFANKKVLVRFVYALGSGGFVDVVRQGWYVDDITIDTGTFNLVGKPTAKTFTVADRPKGDYAYRVRAVSTSGLRTPPSNVRFVKVTRTDGGGTLPTPLEENPMTPAAPGTPGTTPGTTPAAGTTARPVVRTPARVASKAIRASITRRVLKGRRLQLACRLANAKVRSCTIRVLVRRGGKLRTLRTIKLTGSKKKTIVLGRVRTVTLRGTVVSTAGKSFTAPTRTLTRE